MSVILTAPPRKKNGSDQVPRRPSLLDPLLTGDPWMVTCSLPGLLVLDVKNCPIALQPGTGLEQATFNTWIFRLRNTPPRGWMQDHPG